MDALFFKPEDGWAGDPIPFYNTADGKFYIFYLHDTRAVPQTAYKTSWHLAVTADFTEWQDMGCVLPAGGFTDCDLCCYTGCVTAGRDCLYHLFYTAQNPENPAYLRDGRPIQYIVHATSTDLIHWTKHPDSAFTACGPDFSPFDWRDPHVFWDPDFGRYGMLLAARLTDGSFRRGGCTAVCFSDDLWSWSAPEIFYAPGRYYTHECPDLFCIGDWWYLVYSTFTERFAAHYRMSRSLKGPWLTPDQDTFDARGLYAIKTASSGERRFCFGWIPTRAGHSDLGFWEWGGTLAVHEFYQLPDGSLAVKPPQELLERAVPLDDPSVFRVTKTAASYFSGRLPEAFSAPLPAGPGLSPGNLCGAFRDGRGGHAASAFPADPSPAALALDALESGCLLFERMPSDGLLHAVLRPSPGLLSFGLLLFADDTLENGCYLRFEPLHRRLVLDLWPRGSLDGEQHRLGGDVPFLSSFERYIPDADFSSLELRLVVRGQLFILYVNDRTALSGRFYGTGRRWGLFAARGCLAVDGLKWYRLP